MTFRESNHTPTKVSSLYKICTRKNVLQRSLITFFQLKKTTAESYQLLVEVYWEYALTQKKPVNESLYALKVVILM